MKTIILFALLLIPQLASSAELDEWYKSAIKSSTPNELAYYVLVSPDCPVTEQETSKHIEGEFIRGRIKPLQNQLDYNRVYLNVVIDCLKQESAHPVFIVKMNFGKYNPKPAILFDKTYGQFGTGGKEFIINTYKKGLERAVTDYIKANFNL